MSTKKEDKRWQKIIVLRDVCTLSVRHVQQSKDRRLYRRLYTRGLPKSWCFIWLLLRETYSLEQHKKLTLLANWPKRKKIKEKLYRVAIDCWCWIVNITSDCWSKERKSNIVSFCNWLVLRIHITTGQQSEKRRRKNHLAIDCWCWIWEQALSAFPFFCLHHVQVTIYLNLQIWNYSWFKPTNNHFLWLGALKMFSHVKYKWLVFLNCWRNDFGGQFL